MRKPSSRYKKKKPGSPVFVLFANTELPGSAFELHLLVGGIDGFSQDVEFLLQRLFFAELIPDRGVHPVNGFIELSDFLFHLRNLLNQRSHQFSLLI